MGVIIFEITAMVLAVALLIFIALDDRKNRKIREEEDRQKALEEQKSLAKTEQE